MSRFASSRFFLIAALSGALGCTKGSMEDRAAPPPEQAATAPTSDAESIEVLLENDVAKVVRVRLAPGQAQSTHEAPARVVYSVTDSRIRWTEAGEDLGERTWEAGDVHFHAAGPHAAENLAEAPAEWLVFSRKADPVATEGEGADPADESPEQLEVLFDNDRFLVGKVRLEPDEVMPEHAGRSRVIYSLTSASLAYREGEGEAEEKSFDAGDVHFHGPSVHALTNTGSEPLEMLVVVYKDA